MRMRIIPNRDDVNWRKHTLVAVDGKGSSSFDYRPVHIYTLTDEVSLVPLKARASTDSRGSVPDTHLAVHAQPWRAPGAA